MKNLREYLNSESMGDKTYELLKKLIIKGQFAPGERLKEEELSDALEVSRTPLREAMKRLELEGWVVKRVRSGVHVSEISEREVKELYGIREVLEGLMTKEAIKEMNSQSLEELEGLIDKMDKAAYLQDSEMVVEYGEKFHELIHLKSSNFKCMELCNNVTEHIQRYRYLGVQASPQRGKIAGDEHRLILDAIKSRNPDHAEQAMREHIRKGSQAVLEGINRYFLNKKI